MAIKKVSANGTQFIVESDDFRTKYWNKPWTKIDHFDDDQVTLREESEGEMVVIKFTEFFEGDGTTAHATESAIVTYLGTDLEIGK